MKDVLPQTPCAKVRAKSMYSGKQGLTYGHGISAESVGAKGICMHMLTIPAGARAKAHLHESHETAIYVIAGDAVMFWGETLENRMETSTGDLIYIPAGVPHLPVNMSGAEATVVLARTDPNEQESVVLRPDLEHLVPV